MAKKYDPSVVEPKWPRTTLTSPRGLRPRSRGALLRGKQRKYDPSAIEPYWQDKWEEEGIYEPDLRRAAKPFYNLMMFPYPSAEGLHVGNMYAFTGSDIYGRFKRMQGFSVFEPMGLDGFGIHSENYALKVGKHPAKLAKETEKNFYRQLRATGNGYAWKEKLETYDPNYYKWTQWIFVQMFKRGLAYRGKAPVNWCPSCKTVLADEQVINGACERCKTVVERKQMEQWFFKITKYAEKLLKNLETINWSEKVKIAQRNWIGKSEGATIKFKVKSASWRTKLKVDDIEVFTTRPDTLFGATFIVLSPQHPFVASLLNSKLKEVEDYVERARKKIEQERIAEEKDKTGVFTGFYCLNPVSGEKIPIWVADYVLMEYGTGAIMGVPAHDQRDFEFARKYKLPVIQVVAKEMASVRSFLMGGDAITDEDLMKLGIKTIELTPEGYKKIEIPKEKITSYEKLIIDKLTLGFWNEYISDEIVFLFKYKDGKVERIVLSPGTEERIDKLAHEFNDKKWNRSKSSVWRWLAENNWYTDLIIHDETGVVINSDEWDGLKVPKEIGKIIEWLEKKGIGKRQIHYHLRDWLISRQRYWGPPTPMINCPKCGWQPVPEEDLPVLLPEVEDWRPKGTGKSPLANVESFVNVACPECGGAARRETDVSDTFLDSAWYYLRYPSVGISNLKSQISNEIKKNKKLEIPWDGEITRRWLPVDMYVGGAEHSVLHLLYTRFLTMVFNDWGLIDFEEPFKRFYAHGLLISEGAKMSKSKGNVVIPDAYITRYGADTLRCYLMFLGPFDQGGDFRDTGILGLWRFLNRVWKLVMESIDFDQTDPARGPVGLYPRPMSSVAPLSAGTRRGSPAPATHRSSNLASPVQGEPVDQLERVKHQTIKKVTKDIENLRYNTALATLMEYYNELANGKWQMANGRLKENLKTLLLLLAPFAPHITEELWFYLNPKPYALNPNYSIHTHPWPQYDKQLIAEEKATVVVSVNGKMRGKLKLESSRAGDKKEVEKLALRDPRVQKYLGKSEVKKTVFVPGKLINFVV